VLVPKILTTLRAYDRAQFLADLGAGVIVGIVALPLAIAFAIAHLGLATVPRPEFAVLTVAREDRRRQPRPPG